MKSLKGGGYQINKLLNKWCVRPSWVVLGRPPRRSFRRRRLTAAAGRISSPPPTPRRREEDNYKKLMAKKIKNAKATLPTGARGAAAVLTGSCRCQRAPQPIPTAPPAPCPGRH